MWVVWRQNLPFSLPPPMPVRYNQSLNIFCNLIKANKLPTSEESNRMKSNYLRLRCMWETSKSLVLSKLCQTYIQSVKYIEITTYLQSYI